jgi:hypothetical protein
MWQRAVAYATPSVRATLRVSLPGLLRWRISVQTKPLPLGSDCSCELNERRRNSRRGRGVECETVCREEGEHHRE